MTALSIHARMRQLEEKVDRLKEGVRLYKLEVARLRDAVAENQSEAFGELRRQVDEMEARVDRIGSTVEKKLWRTSGS